MKITQFMRLNSEIVKHTKDEYIVITYFLYNSYNNAHPLNRGHHNRERGNNIL